MLAQKHDLTKCGKFLENKADVMLDDLLDLDQLGVVMLVVVVEQMRMVA